MAASPSQLKEYTRVDVETASQGKLIVMLFNGAIKRAEEARRQMDKGQTGAVHNNLIRAQDIVAELRSALNMDADPVAGNLDRVYEYFQHLLITANVKKSAEPIDECVTLMTSIRDAWQELFDKLAREEEAPKNPTAGKQHGASVLNLQG